MFLRTTGSSSSSRIFSIGIIFLHRVLGIPFAEQLCPTGTAQQVSGQLSSNLPTWWTIVPNSLVSWEKQSENLCLKTALQVKACPAVSAIYVARDAHRYCAAGRAELLDFD